MCVSGKKRQRKGRGRDRVRVVEFEEVCYSSQTPSLGNSTQKMARVRACVQFFSVYSDVILSTMPFGWPIRECTRQYQAERAANLCC